MCGRHINLIDFKIGHVRKISFRDARLMTIDNFSTYRDQFADSDVFCSQHAGVYSRTVAVGLNVTDGEVCMAKLLCLRDETR